MNPSCAKKPLPLDLRPPFENMSGEPGKNISAMESADIITDLSNVSALSVVARNTSFTFKGQSIDVKEVAQKLGVTHVLEGSVRKAANRVRIGPAYRRREGRSCLGCPL